MFVFKAAVVGAGTMGGQIAQTIAAAGVPVMLKDIDDALVQAGIDEARNVTRGQVAKLVEKGRLSAEQGEAQVAEVLGRIQPTTSYEGFGDVDFVIEAVPERMEIKQAVFAELDACTPGHAILASNTSSLSISEIAEATLRPDKVVGFHYFYPASVMPLIEIVEGEETSAETVTAAVTFAQAIRKQPITCAEVPGFVVNRILNSRRVGDLARAGAEGPLDQADRRGRGRGQVAPMGPYFLVNLLGLDTVLHVAEHLVESYGEERFYVPKGDAEAGRRRETRRQDRRRRLLRPAGRSPTSPARTSPTSRQLVELLSLKTLRRGLPGARGGRRHPPRHRLRDDGRRRARPPPRADAALHEGRRRRPRRGARADGERAGAPRRALRAADDPAPPGRPGPARPEERPGLLRLPAARRRAAGRDGQARDARATGSRSRGWPTAR